MTGFRPALLRARSPKTGGDKDGSGSMAARRERTCLAGQPSLQLRRRPKGRFARAADMAALRRVSGLEPSGRRSKTALQSEEGLAGRRVKPPGQQEGSHDTGTSPSSCTQGHLPKYADAKPSPSPRLRISVRRFGKGCAGTARSIAPSHRSERKAPDSPLTPMPERYADRPRPGILAFEAVSMAAMTDHQTGMGAVHGETGAPTQSRLKEPRRLGHQRLHPTKLDGPS